MSGTSLDGIDVVIVDFDKSPVQLVAHSTTPYEPDIKYAIENAVNSKSYSLHALCQLDRKIAKAYAFAVNHLLKTQQIQAAQICAIGCHGQTIKHSPDSEHGYTLQIGDPNTLSALCNINVVADFRRKDIALGGQGAPLTPTFHQHAFQAQQYNRAIINIGGIANITALPQAGSKQKVMGFDTGPGNTLIDHLCLKYFNCPYDNKGEIAQSGQVDSVLLKHIFSHEAFFNLTPPKSTGTDSFNLAWFEHYLSQTHNHISPVDQLATATELTAHSIAQSIKHLPVKIDEIYYCGGGQHNQYLMTRLSQLTHMESLSTKQLGIHPDWVEAIAFAWFAKNTIEHKSSNLPSVTFSSKAAILGAIFNA